jgi:Glycosyl hydrolases family 43/Carbohydrate binding module (family 6)
MIIHLTRMLNRISFALLFIVVVTTASNAQNPLIRNMYSADPSARVFNDRVYVYPSHDILAQPGKGRVGWFCMEDYHVYSSANLTDWTDHGVIVTQNKVPWVKPDSYSMWAPDCVFRDGKYYFYFPTTPKDTTFGRGFAIGVAVADQPSGPFVPEPNPIANVHGIDPNVFIDKDGQAYIYYSAGNIFCAKLKKNMTELDGEPKILGDLPTKGLKEGPYLFERNGTYYLTFPHVENKIERLEYATSNNPMGPFKMTGVIMDESESGCWTNHQSIIQYHNQWYLFYHNDDLSPKFDKARSIRADSLFFNEDGTIRKVVQTLRGVGITPATAQIQMDRYSAIGNAKVDFIDTADRFKGWKTSFSNDGDWVRYNKVDFGKKLFKTLAVTGSSTEGAMLQLRRDSEQGAVIAEIKVPAGANWTTVQVPAKTSAGVHDLILMIKSGKADIDWISFK